MSTHDLSIDVSTDERATRLNFCHHPSACNDA